MVRLLSFVSTLGPVLFSSALAAVATPPATTNDGLQLHKSEETLVIYVRPGADFAQYQRVTVLNCQVYFQKNWQRDYNSSRLQSQHLTESDVENIRTALVAACNKAFEDELRANDSHELVDVVAADVLALRPVLVNVELSAPDLTTAGPGGTVVRTAGQMTLVLEFWDLNTKTILARMMDAQAIQQNRAKPANRASTQSAADKILRRWAEEARKHLAAVSTPPSG